MDKKELTCGVIGCGNLGTALINGLIDAGVPAANLTATRRHTEALAPLAAAGVTATSDNRLCTERARVIILSVKPYNTNLILNEIAAGIDPHHHIVVSVATGIDTAHLAAGLPEGTPIFRAMPNTAADVGESLTCICHLHAGTAETDVVNAVFSALGKVIFIDEELMDSATVMGACGIAFVMRFVRAMVQGGIEIGFDARTAGAIVQQTVLGAATLLAEGDSHPESEIDKVTTPKGCTIAGLNEMEHHGFSSALIKGITTSFEKIGK